MFLARYDGEIRQSETMYKINVLNTTAKINPELGELE